MGPRFGNEDPKQHGWDQCCGACTTSRGVTERQGMTKDWPLKCGCQVKRGGPWTTGAISSSRSLSRGFDELHARTPPLTSNTADGSRCTQLAGVPPVVVMYGRPRARGPTRLGRQNRPAAHHQSKRSKPKLGRTEWPRLHIHGATWLACLINRRCQRPPGRRL